MTSRSPRSFQRVATLGLASAVLVLSACGGGSDDASGTAPTDAPVDATVPDTSPSVTESPATAPEATAPEATAPEATEPATTEPDVDTTDAPVADPAPAEEAAPISASVDPAAAGDASCLVGDWVISQDEMNGYYDALEANLAVDGPSPDFDIVGNVLLSFGETDYTYVGDFDLTIDVAGQTGTGQTSGTVTGTWDVVDGLVVTTLGSSDLDVTITIAGVTLSGSDFANGILDSAPINGAPFDCAGPTIGFQLGAPDGPRHDVLLTPA